MATTATVDTGGLNKEYQSENTGSAAHDHAPYGAPNGANGTQRGYGQQAGYGNGHGYGAYGGNPLAHTNTGESARFPAFGGELQPGLYRPTTGRKFANPAPLGLSAFALTTFLLSLINVSARGVDTPNIVVAAAFAYGGLVQLLAGMWEMAVGNTFGATALSSYGGFWISVGIILTPGGFNIVASYSVANGNGVNDFNYAFGFFLFGWFIFTTVLLICTLRSTVAFFLLFFFLDIAFLMLGLGRIYSVDGAPRATLTAAGGYFGLFAAFMAWYNALAGIADDGNSFFLIPVAHFPWSVQGRQNKAARKDERATV